MSTIKKFEKPIGMRDTFPNLFEKHEYIRGVGREFLRQRGFDFIKTPALEYYDTIGKASAIYDASLFKLVDNQGNTLVLRPDMTTPIARVATSKLLKEKIPLRLAYFANVFRAQQMEGGRPAEFGQMGIEIIGDKSVYADAEVIMTLVHLLQSYNINAFKITIGHAGLLQLILQNNTNNEEQVNTLRKLLVEKNYVGFEEAVNSFDLDEDKKDVLIQFVNEGTNISSVEHIEKYVKSNEALDFMKELEQLIVQMNISQYVIFDFTLASHMSYYTGMLFEVFANGSGFPLGNGGRYDGLMHYFGSDVGAIGFGVNVGRLLEVIPSINQKEETVVIIYDNQKFVVANELATQYRQANKRVTVQSKAGLDNEEAFIKLFDEVVYVN